MEKWVKSELLDSFATIFLVIIIAYGGILMSTNKFIIKHYIGTNVDYDCGGSSISVSNINDVFDLFECRMRTYANVLYEIQEASVSFAGWKVRELGIFFSLIGLPAFQGGYRMDWYRDMEKGRSLAIMSASVLIPINALAIVIQYLKANMITIFLPLGLFLRSFRLTRGLGAFFISFALAAYFIFPWTYLMLDPNYHKPVIPKFPSFTRSNSCYPSMSSITGFIRFSNGNTAYSQMTMDSLTKHYSDIYTRVLLTPFIAAAVALIVTKYGTNILGGESSEIMKMSAKML